MSSPSIPKYYLRFWRESALVDTDAIVGAAVSQQGGVIKRGSRSCIGRRNAGSERRIEGDTGGHHFSGVGYVEYEILNIDCQRGRGGGVLLPINRAAGKIIVDLNTAAGVAVVDIAVTIERGSLRKTVISIESRNPDSGIVMRGLYRQCASLIERKIIGNSHLIRVIGRKIGGRRIIALQ